MNTFALLGLAAASILLLAPLVAIITAVMRGRKKREEAFRALQNQLLQVQRFETMGSIASASLHDIDNYLAAIRGHCELVRMACPEDFETTQRMDAVIRIVLKTSSLTDRILDFGRSREPVLEAVHLNRLVRGMCEMLSPVLGTQVRMKQQLADGLWKLEADPSQLEQILVNLLVNARDAMPTGGEVVIETANAVLPSGRDGSPGAEHVMLAVSDTGGGIAPEVHDRIFEPFFSTKGADGHSGLGLAMVYGIVQQSAGLIELESECGVGTCFRIFLPCSEAPSSFSIHDEEPIVTQR